MKRLFWGLGVLCACIGIGWAGYVLYSGGEASPGGALIAVICSLVFFQIHRSMQKK